MSQIRSQLLKQIGYELQETCGICENFMPVTTLTGEIPEVGWCLRYREALKGVFYGFGGEQPTKPLLVHRSGSCEHKFKLDKKKIEAFLN